VPVVKANGIDIYFDAVGDETRSAILLIGGLGWQSIAWDDIFCEQLAERGFYVVRFDNRDTGLSTWFSKAGIPDLQAVASDVRSNRKPTVPYTIDDMARDGVGLMDALGIGSAHVCGASLGGMVAQAMAINYPGRVLSLTSVMSTTGNPELPPGDVRAMAVAAAPRINSREAAAKRAVDLVRVAGSPKFPRDEMEIVQKAHRSFDRAFNAEGVARQMAAVIAHGDRRPGLRKLDVKALIVHGAQDPLVQLADGLDTHESIAGSDLLVIDGMGHELPEGAWKQIIDGMQQLARRA
jgi:pimeloyl-ACP methyl ester carboxylesterase